MSTPKTIELTLRRDEGPPRIGFYHRNEMIALEGGGMRMKTIPDPKGPSFTTICTFDYYDNQWPQLVIAALSANLG